MATTLTNLNDLKLALTATGNPAPPDANLEMFINQASDLIEEYIGRTIGQNPYTEIIQGNNTQYIRLRNTPVVVGGLSVYLDEQAQWGSAPGSFAPGTLQQYGQDYALVIDQPDGVTSRCGMISKSGGYWPKPVVRQWGLLSPSFGEMGNVKVNYIGGYAAVPNDLQMACHLVIANLIRMSAFGGPVLSENLGAYSYSVQALKKLDPLEAAYFILRRYKRFVIG